MTKPYSLTDLFKEYKFSGTIEAGKNRRKVPFSIEVFAYDPKTRLFVAKGMEKEKLSGIVGVIIPWEEDKVSLEFRQLYDLSLGSTNRFCSAILEKAAESISLEGSYLGYGPCNRSDNRCYFSLTPAPRNNSYTMGWMEKAMEVQFPIKR